MSMTESEARSRLSYLKSKAENALSNTNSNCEWAKKDVEGTIVALDMAITTLEEIQQYRAIGTVSEFQQLKEKATAKSREIIQGEYLCPICGCKVNYQGYCHYCGQRVY